MNQQQDIIIYRTADGRASVALYAKDGTFSVSHEQSKACLSYAMARKRRKKFKDLAQPTTDG